MNAYDDCSCYPRPISRVTRIVHRWLQYQQDGTVLGTTGSWVCIPFCYGMKAKLTFVLIVTLALRTMCLGATCRRRCNCLGNGAQCSIDLRRVYNARIHMAH